MTLQEELVRAIEHRDVEAVLATFDEEADYELVDRTSPPSSVSSASAPANHPVANANTEQIQATFHLFCIVSTSFLEHRPF